MGKEGYISLHRSLLDNPIFNSEPYTKGQAWVTILMLANYKEGFVQIKNGELIKVERGECGYSELALSDIFKWSRGKVKRFLNLLESEKMIQQKIRSNRTIIKICNYELYQNRTVNDTVNSTVNDTVNGHLTIQQTDINNKDNKDNNDNNIFLLEKEKKLDPYINPISDFYMKEYKKIIGRKCYLNNQHRNKIIELSADIENFKETIPKVLEKLKNLKFDDISNFTPSSSWLLKNDNYIKLLEGAFDNNCKNMEEIDGWSL